MIDYKSIPVFNYSYVANAVSPSVAIFTDKSRNVPVWTCADWITFFNALKDKNGEASAKEIWSWWWNLGLSKSAGGMGDGRAGSGLVYDSVPLDCRSFNSDFRTFLDKYKLSDTVYKGLGNITKPIGVVTDVVGDVGSAISSTGKILKYGIPILLIAGAGLLIWYGVRKVQKS